MYPTSKLIGGSHGGGEIYPRALVQIQKMKNELETLHQLLSKTSETIYMDNRLKELEELLLDNALLKLQNQALIDKNPKWK